MSVSSNYAVIYLDIFAGLVGLICRFFCVIASLFIASRIKKRELVSNRAAIASILMLINTLISMDASQGKLPNAIICKLEVLHDAVPSFVSRSLPYCQVVGL